VSQRQDDPETTVVLPVVTGAAGGPRSVPYDADATVILPAPPEAPEGTAAAGPHLGTHGPDLDSTGAVARNSVTMAIGSMVSRGTGFLRTAVLGAAIGAAALADDYTLANTLPNMVYELLLGGVLASVIVPLLVRARRADPDRGEAYTQRLLSLATIAVGGATVIAVACAPLLTWLMANRSPAPDRHLITVLGYLLLPEIFFYGIAALLAAVLNTRGHFAAPMWTPILNNVVVIVTAIVFMTLPSKGLTPDALTTAQLLVLGVGTTLGIVAQAAGLVPALRRVGFRWRWRWDFRQLRLPELGRMSGWMLGYVVVSQISVVVVLKLSKLAGNRGGPGPAIYNNAFLIFMMANGIVAVSIVTALMPRMSAAAADRRYADVADQLSFGTRLTAVVLIPVTAAYLVLGRPLAVTLFRWHNYTGQQAVATGTVIAIAGLGLMPFAISNLQNAAFYALADTRVPALVNVPVVVVRIAVDVALYLLLPVGLITAGLMLGTGLSYLAGVILLSWLLRRRIGRLGLSAIIRTLVRLALAALVAALPTLLIVVTLGRLLGNGKAGSAVQLVVGGLVLVAVYLAVAVALRVREVRELTGMLRTRLGR
jgi:putative peptidoglycan lipid II flippase